MNKNNWATPKEVFHPLDDIFHFDLDVCADSMNHKTPTYISEKEDALLCKWAGVCWMNPPYERGKINSFMKKAWQEYCEGTQIVALVPASMSSVWFHRYALKGRIYIRQGRIRFLSPETHVTEGSPKRDNVLVVYFQNAKDYDEKLSEIGWKCINE